MPCQLLPDCLNDIFEFLEKDKVTLYSCLLVNRLWCEVSVRILWRYNYSPQIFCLPNESKNLLHRNGIFISTPTSKPPLFNYASYCKVLSVDKIDTMVERFLHNARNLKNHTLRSNFNSNKDLVIQEIYKVLMKQTSMKKLSFYCSKIPNLTQFPGARDCLTDLSKLSCSLNVNSEFFYQLSQVCHNIQSINIELDNIIPNGLEHLISSQNNLKGLSILVKKNRTEEWKSFVPSLMRCSNTLIKLKINVDYNRSYFHSYFNELQYVTFSRLQILKFSGSYLNILSFIRFLETNGNNLKEFYANDCSKSINLAIAKFCPNLKSLYTNYYGGLGGLETIFHSCEQLEKITVKCSTYNITEKQIFEIVAKYSPKNFHELELYSFGWSGLLTSELESFFDSWKNRIPYKPFSLIIESSLDNFNYNMKVIEKYRKLGVIKKFEVKTPKEGKLQ